MVTDKFSSSFSPDDDVPVVWDGERSDSGFVPKGEQADLADYDSYESMPSPSISSDASSAASGGNVTPASPSPATPTLNGNGSSSLSTTTTTTVASPYAQFKGNNYEELEEFLRAQMESVKPETKEEREKREKREKRLGFLARLAEGLGTFHTAFSHARGIKAMDMPKMSAKAKELFEKAKAQRDKDNDRLVNYAITLGNINDKDRDFNFRVAQAEQQQANWERKYESDRADRAAKLEMEARVYDARANAYEAQGRKEEAEAERRMAEAARAEAQAERERSAARLNDTKAEWHGKESQSRINANNARAEEARAQGAAATQRAADNRRDVDDRISKRGRGNASDSQPYGTFLGKSYSKKADYDQAVMSAASRLGVSTRDVLTGRSRSIAEIAAEVSSKALPNARSNEGSGRSRSGLANTSKLGL